MAQESGMVQNQLSFIHRAEETVMATESFVQCENLVKIYKIADLEVVALQGLNLGIAQGEMMALIGPSGVGNVIGGLDIPSAGNVSVGGWDLLRMKERQRVEYKRRIVGFVWQQPARNLLPYLSARENVELPMQHSGVKADVRKKRALDLLDTVGLADRADFHPDRLSGGEQQRVALTVALANNPPLLLGDELTGQLDSKSAMDVFDALVAINQAYGTTVIVVTHSPLLASRLDRVVTVRDGRTSTEIRRRRNQKEGIVLEEEWIILDPVGRLQLPGHYVNTLEMRELVRLHLEPDHISVWPKEADDRQVMDDGQPSSLPHLWPDATDQQSAVGVWITTQNLTRTFELAGEDVHALRSVNLEVPAGSLTAIKGPSGSGKTTLLNLIAGLDEPTAGTVHSGEQELAELSPQEMIERRR
jgi:ABC-type lipoprotein export system ATPase subunit